MNLFYAHPSRMRRLRTLVQNLHISASALLEINFTKELIMMRKFAILSTAFMLVIFLLAGCGGDDDDDDNDIIGPDDMETSLYSMEPGDWSELRTPDGDRSVSKFIGEDTWEGRSCIILEFEDYSAGGQSVSQTWIDKTDGEAVLFLVEMDGEIVKFDPGTAEDVPGEDDAWDEPGTEEIGTEQYTTPTGKTVEATVYKTQTTYGVTEDWVSSEVPFDLVKELVDGELESSLYDFGTGATRIISREDAENAEPFEIPDIPDIPGIFQ
jgi:hypothetical protein